MKLIILRNTLKKYSIDDATVVITSQDLTRLAKSGGIIKHLFRYSEVRLFCYSMDFIVQPFFTAVLLRFVCHGECIFEDDFGAVRKITFHEFFKLFINFVTATLKKNALLNNCINDISECNKKMKVKEGVSLDLTVSPVYLRTDLWFGIRAGGSVGHIAGVLNNLKKLCKNPVFFTSDKIPTVRDDIEARIIAPNISLLDYVVHASIDYTYIVEKEVYRRFAAEKVSFFYQRYSLNNFTGVKLSQALSVPFVLEYNGSEIWIAKNWGKPLKHENLSGSIEMLNLRAADLIVVVSRPMRAELIERGIDEEKILVNPNGVDPVRYSPKVDGTEIRSKFKMEAQKVIGFIGTFGKWHGAEVLVAAYGKLLQEHGEYRGKVKLFMIGDGITMPLVKKEIEHYGIQKDCILTGLVPQEKGPGYLAACDLLVAPHVPNADGTPFFGSPTKLFEYMAMGKGIVASDLDQIGEVLDHGQTAWLVKPGDKNDLAEGLRILIDDEQLCADLGNNARAQAENNYTWEKHTERIIDKLRSRCN